MDDVPLQDCYLVCRSGRRFPSNTVVLASHSVVLRDVILSCKEDLSNSRQENKRPFFEIPLRDETEEAIELLWQHIHGKTSLLDIFDFLLDQGNTESDRSGSLDTIFELTRLADKYCIDGAQALTKPFSIPSSIL